MIKVAFIDDLSVPVEVMFEPPPPSDVIPLTLTSASTHPTATECVQPTGPANIDHLSSTETKFIFDEFMKYGITPAYGGAKIFKVLRLLREGFDVDLSLEDSPIRKLSDVQLLTAVDKHYTAKKYSFGEKYGAWAQTTTGKKTIGTPVPTVKHVVAPVTSESPPTGLDVPGGPTITDPVTGDISHLDYFAKQDIWEAWLEVGGGKKVTPAYGGAKIFKQLQELKTHHKVAPYVLNDLQLLRVIDDAGGFVGKPKTYESVVINWLESPASAKTLTKLGVTEVPSSLKKTVAGVTTDTPKVKSVVPPKLDLSPDVEQTLSTGESATAHTLFNDLGKYATNDVVAYARGKDGELYSATKVITQLGTGVIVRRWFEGHWVVDAVDDVFTYDANDLVIAYQDKISLWNLKVPKSLDVGKTKIPGKGPNDTVTFKEIIASKSLWDAGDVVAIGDDVKIGLTWKLISDGQGGFEIWNADISVPDSWIKVTNEDIIKSTAFVLDVKWHLAGDVLSGRSKKSNMPDIDAGDVVTVDQLWELGGVDNSKTIAYAVTETGHTYRFMFKISTCEFVVQSKPVGFSTWFDTLVVKKKSDLDVSYLKGVTWHAATADGGSPLEVSTKIPTATQPSTTSTHIPGKRVGDSVTYEEIFDHSKEYADGEIIAVADGVFGHFRIIFVDGFIVKQKRTKSGAWKNDNVVVKKTHFVDKFAPWKAANGVISPAQHKSAKQFIAKFVPGTAPKVAPEAPKAQTPSGTVPSASDDPDIRHISDEAQKEIFSAFKGMSAGQLLTSSEQDILANMWAWATQLSKQDPVKFGQLTVLQVARAVDVQISTKLGKMNAHLFENKIKAYLASDAGKKYVESGAYKVNALVKEVFQTDVDVPEGVTLSAGELVQPVTGPGAFDPMLSSAQFRSTTPGQQQAIQTRMLATRPWSQREKEGLREYTSGAYYSYNGYLRQTKGYEKAGSNLRSKILYTQAGMRPIDENILVLRGSGWEQLPEGYRTPVDSAKLVGKTISDPAFLSTSTAGKFGGFGGALRLEIEVPRGTMVAYVNSISHNKGENEVIIAAGSRYRIINVTPPTSGYGETVIRMRVVS